LSTISAAAALTSTATLSGVPFFRAPGVGLLEPPQRHQTTDAAGRLKPEHVYSVFLIIRRFLAETAGPGFAFADPPA
jgi:hypothetical protein